MEDNVRIILTTRGRINKQFTLRNICDEIKSLTTIVCYPGEKIEHEKNWGSHVFDVIEHPKEFTHLGQIRKWCIEYFKEDFIILMDDNLQFCTRQRSQKMLDNNVTLPCLTDKHFDEYMIIDIQLSMFIWVIDQLKANTFGVVGLGCREGNNRIIEDYSLNSRIYGFWAVNKNLYSFLSDKDKWADFPNKNDFALQLEFLTNNIKTIRSNYWVFNKAGGANSKGGCSIYRNLESSNKEAYDLKDVYTPFVNVKNKRTKSWGGDFKDIAIDNIISWKKAYESAKK